MIISYEYPPIIDQIVAVFPDAAKPGVIYTFGEILYNPSKKPITRELMRHEEIHSVRQGRSIDQVAGWWAKYLKDPEFRFAEEWPAHVAEFKAFRPGRNGFNKAGFLNLVAERLSGPLYGNMVTKQEAMKLLREG